ncbi:MAG: hypothetical protein PUD20_00750, partial [bacterium]|nr:hypothetical protein [bacterium]
MKMKELQKKFQSKFAIRMMAGVLSVALLGTSFSIGYLRGSNDSAVITAEAAQKAEIEEKINELVGKRTGVDNTTKDETVYIIADAKGNSGKVIVEEWLKNPKKEDTLEDVSELKDITNIKGYETFTQNGEKLTWQANGNDIYYEGTTDKQVPITEKVTYFLDGKEIEPEELAGKSGKVTVRFDYENHEKVSVDTEDGPIEVYVPFTVMTGMVLSDSFTNIEVTNGRVISDGKNNIVVGMAMPGLHESLHADASDFDTEIEFPEYVEMTADVEDFSLEMTASIAMTGLLSDLSLGDLDLSEMEDSVDTLADATDKLEDGSKQLADGLSTLKDNMGDFTSGADQLKNGIKDYTDGAQAINDGLAKLNSSVGTLSDGADKLDASAKTIAAGVKQLDHTLKQEMSEEQKAGVVAAVDAQFAEGSDTYNYIYQNAAKNFSDTMTSKQTVGTIQSGIAGMGLTSDDVVAALAKYYAANGFVDTTTGKKYSPAECQATVPGANVTYAAYFAGTVLKGGLAQGLASGIATNGAQAVGASVVDACKTAAESAAVSGAESTKSMIAASIEAVDKKSGYSLVTGSQALSKGISTMAAGIPAMKDGIGKLATGADTLVANNEKLTNGITDLAEGSIKISDGVDQLDDGASKLYDGMVEFNKEGISKLVDAFNGDASDLLNRIDAVFKAGEQYTSYA